MIAYPDTSFLCALYRRQDNSEQALAYRQTMTLSFDANQNQLAAAEGLATPLTAG